jgi:glycosyltransferase involved in cell wall biosynthesis
MPRTINAMTGLGYAFSNTDVKAHIIKMAFSLIYRFIMTPPRTFALFQNDDDRSAFVQAELVPAEQTAVIHGSGVDLEKFHPLTTSPPLPVIIVLASRMLWDKGVGEFVKAARSCHAQGLQARFILVGDSDPDNPAAIPRKQLQAWHDSGEIEWWGWRNDMDSILQEAHIFCLPSYREGVSKAMLEALATGLPIVTTDGPGCRDLVHNQANGFLVPVQDTTSLTEALAKLIMQPELRQQMGAASREIAQQHYSIEIIVNATQQLCHQLLTQ